MGMVNKMDSLPQDPSLQPERRKKKMAVEEKAPELPVWKKHGFKKLVGGLLSIIGGILCIIPFKNQGMFYIGVGIAGVGSALLGVGAVHTAIKMEKGIDRSDNVWQPLSSKLKTNHFFTKGK